MPSNKSFALLKSRPNLLKICSKRYNSLYQGGSAMDLLQVVVELRHSMPLKLFSPYEELYSSLTGKELPEKQSPLPGFELTISERRMRIVVDPRRTAIVLGDVPNIGYCVDNVMTMFRKISELAKLPPLSRLGERSYWVEESQLNFDELVSSYKRMIYKPTNIVEESIDIGASFVIASGDCKANVAFGPMELSQLESMFTFKPPKLPKVATFLDVDYYLKMEQKETTERMLRDFVNSGLNYASQQSKRLMSLFEEER